MPGPWDDNLKSLNATITANANGTGFKLGEGQLVRAYLAVTGTVSGTSPTLDVKLQDSGDGSSWADTGVDFAQVTATGSHQEREWRLKAGRPYLRAVTTVGGTSPSFGGVSVRFGPLSGMPTTAAAT